MTIQVLVVDDQQAMRDRVAACVLEAPGLDLKLVGTCASADEAFAQLAQTPVDLVLIDLQMPGMDGVSATSRILRRHPECNVIVISAIADSAIGISALKAGAAHLILKQELSPALLADGIRGIFGDAAGSD